MHMPYQTLDLLLNLVILLFWFRIWANDERTFYFNPYVGILARLTDPVLNFFRPAFPRLPFMITAIFTTLLLLAIRAMVMFTFLRTSEVPWTVAMGFEHPTLETADVSYCMIFSALSFLVFLLKIWTLSVIYVWTRGAPADHAAETIYSVSKPLTLLRAEARPAALVAAGVVTGFMINSLVAQDIPAAWQGGVVLVPLLKLCVSALQCMVDILPAISTTLIILIIGSWISMFSTSESMSILCREWLDMFLGPLRRYPLRIAMLDLTAVVLIFAIQWVYPPLSGLLQGTYLNLK